MNLASLRPVLKNNLALLVQYAAGAAVPLVLIPHLAAAIGLAAFGSLSVLLSWATWGGTFVAYTFHMTGPVQAAKSPADMPRIFGAMLGGRFLLLACTVPVLLAACAVGAIPVPGAAPVALILVGLPLAAALNASWFLQVRDRFFWITLLSIAGTLGGLYVGLRFVRQGDASAVAWAATSLVFGTVVVGAGTFALSLQQLGRLPPVGRAEVAGALREGRVLFLSQLAALVYTSSGPILIGWLGGLENAGIYAVMERLVTSIAGAMLLVHTAAYPLLARLYTDDRRGYLHLATLVCGGYLAIATLAAVVGWVLRDPILGYLYGASGPRPDALYALGLAWVWLQIFGPVLTGYLVVSNRPRNVYTLTASVLAVSLAVGIPGVMLHAGTGWLAGLVAGQAFLAAAALRTWKNEHELLHR